MTGARREICNPWTALPTKPPVLVEDAAAMNSFNAGASKQHRFDLCLFPEPFFGSPLAPVVVLDLNPGWSAQDSVTHANPEFADRARHSLAHALAPYPFLHLQPNGTDGSSIWWRQRTRQLSSELGFDRVAMGLACVQYMPYHSRGFSSRAPLVPSQAYGFELVRRALQRGAEIVVMRSQKLWFSAVPELCAYSRLHVAANPRAPFLSRGNLKDGYDRIIASLARRRS